MEYKVVTSDTAADFERKVNEAIKQGFAFVKGSRLIVLTEPSRWYVREMFKETGPRYA